MIRPLDPLRSVKAKLGVLVAASVAVSSFLVYYGLVLLGWLPRYTLPVAVLAALAVTQLLAHGMTSPLRSMTSAARAMASGDYSRRVHTRSRDEVGELAAAFNRMAADLQAADTTRRELIANVSHELRTPIAALRAVLENVVDGVAEPDPATIRTALAQTERLGRLVSELLDLSRIDAGDEPLTRAVVDLTEVVSTAVAESTLSGHRVGYDVEIDPPGTTVWADAARLHQVLANLLHNAARHSPAGGTVRVRATCRPGATRIEVSDEGPGIPNHDRDRVFERFTTGSRGEDGGTGLGLAIARWAVELHGGRIHVADPGPDASPGATFVIDLPDRDATPTAPDHRTDPTDRLPRTTQPTRRAQP